MIWLLTGNLLGFSLFRGNWFMPDDKDTIHVVNQSSSLQIAIDKCWPKDNFTFIVGRMQFSNATHALFNKRTIKMYGVTDNETGIHYLYNIIGYKEENASTMCSYIESIIINNSIYDSNDYFKLHSLISKKLLRPFQKAEIISVLFKNESNIPNALRVFDSNYGISGNLLWHDFNLTFTANLFKYEMFISEAKIYGVITALTLVMNYFAWKSILNLFQSQSKIQLLSVHSFILHIGFEFSYALFVFDFSMLSIYLIKLFTFVYISMVSLFFILQIKEIGELLKAKLSGMETNESLHYFFAYFGETFVLISFACIFAEIIFDFPVTGSIFLYSFFIPQIIHSAITPGRKHGDEFFTITLSIIRLIPMWYFCLYKRNIMEKHSIELAIGITVYVVLQAILVILQNIFGGAFFLPKKMHPYVFNYFDGKLPENSTCAICMSQIETEDSYMVTPCSHAFHTQCLSRWMEEQLICPICRASLPPFDNGTDSYQA